MKKKLPIDLIEYIVEFLCPEFEKRLFLYEGIYRTCITNFNDIYHISYGHFYHNTTKIGPIGAKQNQIYLYASRYILFNNINAVEVYDIIDKKFTITRFDKNIFHIAVIGRFIYLQTKINEFSKYTTYKCIVINGKLIVLIIEYLEHVLLLEHNGNVISSYSIPLDFMTVGSYENMIFRQLQDENGFMFIPYKFNVITLERKEITEQEFIDSMIIFQSG